MIISTYSAENLFKLDEHVWNMMETPFHLLNLEKFLPLQLGHIPRFLFYIWHITWNVSLS